MANFSSVPSSKSAASKKAAAKKAAPKKAAAKKQSSVSVRALGDDGKPERVTRNLSADAPVNSYELDTSGQ